MSFNDWWTNNNNPTLDKSEYMYGTRHIIVLVTVAVLCILLSLIFFKRNEKTKKILFYVLGSILLFFEIASRVVNLIIAESYTVLSVLEILLPMHICSVMVWMFIIALFTNLKTLKNFAVIGGLLATIAFLLFPAVGLNRVHMSFTCLYSTISHMLGFVTGVLLIVLGQVKFEFKDMWKVYLCFVIMFGWGALLNFVIYPGENYMYIVESPIEWNYNFPYQIVLGGALVVYIFLFYLISWIVKKIKSRKQKA